MRRGEVWWADLPAPVGRRPVLLLSRDEAYEKRNAVTVAQVTTRARNIPVEVSLGREEGLAKSCVVNVDTLVTIQKTLLMARVGVLTSEKMDRVNTAVRFALNL